MKIFNTERFCADISNLRKDSTQQKVAETLGVNRSTLSFLEGGKQTPSLEILNRVCELCKTTPNDYFIEQENDGLLYLMGSLKSEDKSKIVNLMERISIKEKYAVLNKRSI